MKILIILFAVSTACFSQSELKKDSLELWIIGSFANQSAHQIVSKKWPFTTKLKAGDVIDDCLVAAIEQHNKIIWDYLESKGFKNPRNNYCLEVKIERGKIQKAVDLIDKNNKILILHEELRKKERLMNTQIEKINETEYLFRIFSFDLSDIEFSEALEIEFIINIETNNIDFKN